MPLSAQAKNRELFGGLLKLSSAQITALHNNDMKEFDRISVEKRKTLAALAGARAMIDADPPLAQIAARINASEAEAQRILAAKIGQIRSEMNGLRQRAKVRAAYTSHAPLTPRMRLMSSPDTARFLDRKS